MARSSTLLKLVFFRTTRSCWRKILVGVRGNTWHNLFLAILNKRVFRIKFRVQVRSSKTELHARTHCHLKSAAKRLLSFEYWHRRFWQRTGRRKITDERIKRKRLGKWIMCKSSFPWRFCVRLPRTATPSIRNGQTFHCQLNCLFPCACTGYFSQRC